MKIITIQKIGYNHLSQANWSYEIYSLATINTEDGYSMSYILKGAFTSNTQVLNQLKAKLSIPDTIPLLTIRPVHTATGIPKITGLSNMIDTDSSKLSDIITDFINN